MTMTPNQNPTQNQHPIPTTNMADDKLTSLIIIDDGIINRMLRDSQYAAEFPFLANAVKTAAAAGKPAGCGGCAKKRKAQTVVDYNGIKQQIAGLASDRRTKLKQMLGTRQGRVIYRTSDNRTIRLTF